MENTAKSKEKLIAYLEFVRDSEADKPIEEMDVELVSKEEDDRGQLWI